LKAKLILKESVKFHICYYVYLTGHDAHLQEVHICSQCKDNRVTGDMLCLYFVDLLTKNISNKSLDPPNDTAKVFPVFSYAALHEAILS
jgi:hypothetical protein